MRAFKGLQNPCLLFLSVVSLIVSEIRIHAFGLHSLPQVLRSARAIHNRDHDWPDTFGAQSVQINNRKEASRPSTKSSGLLRKTPDGCVGESDLVVCTTEGKIMGRREERDLKVPIRAFRGIPFAEPPLGELRFESPKRRKPWNGIKMTMEYQKPCLSRIMYITLGDEDCLYLDVFVPDDQKISNKGLLPVAFWIHGGGFLFGSEFTSTVYHPRTFTDRGMIFVSVGYRLGPLGFLSTDDPNLPGNYGLKDIAMALKWVKGNIRNFGGDPDKIHVFGQSAGATSAHAITLSPMSQGLMKSVVLMSGSAFLPSMTPPRGRPVAERVAKALDCPSDDTNKMKACLRSRGAKELFGTITEFFFSGVRGVLPFGMVLDPYAKDPFMPHHPLKIIQEGLLEPVPMVAGVVKDELVLISLSILKSPEAFKNVTTDWNKYCVYAFHPAILMDGIMPGDRSMTGLCQRARELFFNNGPIDPQGSEDALLKFLSWIAIVLPSLATAMLHAKYASAPVYFYSFEHLNEGTIRSFDVHRFVERYRLGTLFGTPEVKSVRSLKLTDGPSHLDDALLLFDPPVFSGFKLTEKDSAVKNLYANAFISFWKTAGSSKNGDALRRKEAFWPQFDPVARKYLIFDQPPRISSGLASDDKLKLFADWYDLYMSQRDPSVASNIPSLGRLLFEDSRAAAPSRRKPSKTIGEKHKPAENSRDGDQALR